MVLCIVWGCGSKSGKHKGLGFFRISKIITDQGDEYEKLTRKRREGWIRAVSRGDTAEKNIPLRQKEFAVVILTKDSSLQTGYLP